MVPRKKLLYVASSCFLASLLTGCGGGSGGGGGNPSPSPPATPSFTLSLSPTSMAIMQGGTNQVQVSVTGENGFTGSVSVILAGLPAGVTASPASLSITPGNEATFEFSASSTATLGQQSVSVNGASGTMTANASLPLTVMLVAVPDPYHFVGGTLVHGFYDESRQLLFATNPGLNELDVISGLDFSIKARIPVPQPWGIDQMADGKTLVLGTQAQEIVTVDENTYAVTPHPYIATGDYFYGLFFPMVVALANGEVLMTGLEQGIESNSIYEAGQYLYAWNSNTNTFTQVEPTAQNAQQWYEVDSLARSADHKWAVFSSDQFYLYSSDTSTLTTVPVNAVYPPNDEYGIRGYALNADGTKIAVASAVQVTILNRSLAVLGTTTFPVNYAFQTARSAVQFSSDGTRLFLEYPFPLAIMELDTSSYNVLGYLSATVLPEDDNFERLLATDAEGRAYFGINEGLRVVALTQAPVPLPTENLVLAGPTCPELDAALPLNQSQQLMVMNQPTNVQVYVGGQLAAYTTGSSPGVKYLSIPASSIPGPADVVCGDGSGNITVVPAGVSYGAEPVGFSANLLPPTGNPPGYLFGYGFYASATAPWNSASPSVTLGGEAVASPTAITGYGLGVLEGEGFKVPNGTAGDSANVEVSSSLGSGTLSSAAAYYASPTIVPASSVLQILYDSHRDVLYALKTTEVDVLNLTTLQWLPPLPFPAAAKAAYNMMALSPDGSRLVLAGVVGNSWPLQLIVFNPDVPSSGSVFTYTGNATGGGSIAITKFNTVVLAGLVFDLSTSTFSEPFNSSSIMGNMIRASADGSHLYVLATDNSSGLVGSIDPETYAVQTNGFGYLFWYDLAVSNDGSQFATVDAYDGAGSVVGFFDSSLHYLNANVYPDFSPADTGGVPGAMFSPAGKVLVVPLTDSLEIWDAALGTLRARVMMPEALQFLNLGQGQPLTPTVAMDATGQTIYAISASGITVLKLPEPLDQIPTMQWPNVYSGSQKDGLHGPITARMKARRSKLQARPK